MLRSDFYFSCKLNLFMFMGMRVFDLLRFCLRKYKFINCYMEDRWRVMKFFVKEQRNFLALYLSTINRRKRG